MNKRKEKKYSLVCIKNANSLFLILILPLIWSFMQSNRYS